MRRREFLTLLGGAAAAWPLAARAQQRAMPAIGVLLPAARRRSGTQVRVGGIPQALAELGWTEGRNVRIDYSLGRRANTTGCGASGRTGRRSRRT